MMQMYNEVILIDMHCTQRRNIFIYWSCTAYYQIKNTIITNVIDCIEFQYLKLTTEFICLFLAYKYMHLIEYDHLIFWVSPLVTNRLFPNSFNKSRDGLSCRTYRNFVIFFCDKYLEPVPVHSQSEEQSPCL